MSAEDESLHIQEARRARLQGLGNRINFRVEANGKFTVTLPKVQFREVGHSFHHFLFFFVIYALRGDFEDESVKILLSSAHPLAPGLRSLQSLIGANAENTSAPPSIRSIRVDSEGQLVLRFGWDLFTVLNNATVHDQTLTRIADAIQFCGVQFEIFAAATLIRAGMTIEFSEEVSRDQTHFDFLAYSPNSQKTYSVEATARRRQTAGGKDRIHRTLRHAFAKDGAHDRILFVDFDLETTTVDSKPPDRIRDSLNRAHRALEREFPGRKAYVVVANLLRGGQFAASKVGEYVAFGSIGHSDFSPDGFPDNIERTLQQRRVHPDMSNVQARIGIAWAPPALFTSDNVVLKASGLERRFVAGAIYSILYPGGEIAIGRFIEAVVTPDRIAVCRFLHSSGEEEWLPIGLSDAEYSAYKFEEETFFGYTQPREIWTTPIAAYDWLILQTSTLRHESVLNALKARGVEATHSDDSASLRSSLAICWAYDAIAAVRAMPEIEE